MDINYHSPSRRNYYTTFRDASPEEIRSSLRCVKRDYVEALEEIADLKHEKASLKNIINQSFNDKTEENQRKCSMDMENASQRLKQSYTQKALMEAEQRIVELEDENIKFRRLVDSNSTRLKKLQQQLVSSQDQIDKLGHLNVFNKHLQAEMQYLDQEFQDIIKRVEDLDEEKTKAKIKKSVSVKYSQDYNQTLLKYVNHIINSISKLESTDAIRTRFEELFPISSNILKLIANRDFSNLMLKSFKFIADLLPRDADQEQFSPTFSQATRSSLSPSPLLPPNIQNLDVSRFSSQVTTNSKSNAIQTPSAKQTHMTPTAKNRSFGAGNSSISSEKAKIIGRQDSISSTNNGKNPREGKLSVSFGAKEFKEFKPKLLRSATPNTLRPVESMTSLKSNQSASKRNEVIVHESMVAGQADRKERNASFSSKIAEYQQEQAEELAMIQRERELIEKERELMEKKRELLNKARELQEKEQALQEREEEEQLQQQQEEERAINEMSVEHSRTHGYKKTNSYADMRKIRQEEKERTKSPTATMIRPILKSSSSQIISMDQDNAKKSVNNTPANKANAMKDFSNVLREKSKQLAKVLTGAAAYDDEIQTLNARNEQEGIYYKGSGLYRSKERTPMNYNKNYGGDSELEQLRASKIKSFSSKNPAYEEYVDSPYYPEESDGSDKRSYHPGSGASTFKSNSNIASFHPTPMGSKRKDEREYKREDSGKRVCFDQQNDESMDNDEYLAHQHQQRSASNMRPRELEEDASMSMSMKSGTRYGRPAETPKGTQYASFTVSFGRTESAERSGSPTARDAGSILDAPIKKRVEHVLQTYDVVKGEDLGKIAICENYSPQYKVAVGPSSTNRLKRMPIRTQTPTPSSTKSHIAKNKL